VGTVGIIEARPGAVHTIVGEAEIWVDIRSVDQEPKGRVVARFLEEAEGIAERRGLELTYECSVDEPPVPCAPRVVAEVTAALASAGLEAMTMPSGGGHDAQHMARCTEAGMIFTPSVGGISHTPLELTSWEDLALGADALASCLIRLAGLSSGSVEPGKAG
jgi:N-carbamoyl-L-amino-acid hydrolase